MPIDQFTEPPVLAQLPKIANRIVEDSQCMLEARVRGTGIDPGCQSQLGNVREPLKIRRIDQSPNPRRERDILLHRNSDQPPSPFEVDEFRNFEIGMPHGVN